MDNLGLPMPGPKNSTLKLKLNNSKLLKLYLITFMLESLVNDLVKRKVDSWVVPMVRFQNLILESKLISLAGIHPQQTSQVIIIDARVID